MCRMTGKSRLVPKISLKGQIGIIQKPLKEERRAVSPIITALPSQGLRQTSTILPASAQAFTENLDKFDKFDASNRNRHDTLACRTHLARL